MQSDYARAVFELMLSLPGTKEGRAHGTQIFKVTGKTFAYWVVNHHDDGRVALWMTCSLEQQDELVTSNPELFFVPPYMGVKGWIGLDLTNNPPWALVIEQVCAAWARRAPDALLENGLPEPSTPPPDHALTAQDINPMLGKRAQEVLAGLAQRCSRLPATKPEGERQSATWRVGKKVFLRGDVVEDRLQLLFRVGGEQQAMMLDDPRYSLPVYFHASGWIALDVQDKIFWEEVEGLLETSYRHFALKGHLRQLDESPS